MTTSPEGKKSLWSKVLTSSNLLYLKGPNCAQKCTKRNIGIIAFISFLLIVWQYDVTYWIRHPVKYHYNHFQWDTTLNHEYCSYSPIKESDDGLDLWTLSQSNTESSNQITKVFLLSYVRSGNHLTRAMIECLLQHDTYGYAREYPQYTEEEYTALERSAVENANIDNIYVRKIHNSNIDKALFETHIHDEDIGLIYLIRDPVESILSHTHWVPFYWKDFEFELKRFWPPSAFYEQWKSDNSKLVLYYEDFHSEQDPYINLRKMREFFGKDRVSEEQLNQCIDQYKAIQKAGLESLERKQTSPLTDLHYYRDKFYGKDPQNWPTLKVHPTLYHDLFGRYDNVELC